MMHSETYVNTSPKPRAGTRSSKQAIGAGVVAGLIGGLAMGMVAMIRAWVIGMGFWLPLKQIAAVFYGVDALLGGVDVVIVGMLTHFVVSALYGVIFGLVVGRRTTIGAALLYGLIYGAVIWAVMTYIALPLVNETMQARVALQPIWWFVYHLVFGAAFLLTPPLARAFSRGQGERY